MNNGKTKKIVMGSDSADMPIMAKAAEILDKFGIDYRDDSSSAPGRTCYFRRWAKSAEERRDSRVIS